MRCKWLLAGVLMLAVTGCNFDIDRVGQGEACRHDRECVVGLECVRLQCERPPSESEVDAALPEIEDAGPDGDAEAGP